MSTTHTEQQEKVKPAKPVVPKITHIVQSNDYSSDYCIKKNGEYALGVNSNGIGNCQSLVLRHVQYSLANRQIPIEDLIYYIRKNISTKYQLVVDLNRDRKEEVINYFKPVTNKTHFMDYTNYNGSFMSLGIITLDHNIVREVMARKKQEQREKDD